MSPQPITLVILTAAGLGALHTLLGPDHYVPFVMMARAARWSWRKTLIVTFACGLAHVLSSVVLGAIGIVLGMAAAQLEFVESFRGRLAAWTLIGFGLLYFAWGLQHARRRRPHSHLHCHTDGTLQAQAHIHKEEPLHLHGTSQPDPSSRTVRLAPWVLFTIIGFGPCEPLIPLSMFAAAQYGLAGAALVTMTFGLTTLGAMLLLVLMGKSGMDRLSLGPLEHFLHAIAGASLVLCGSAIYFLGL